LKEAAEQAHEAEAVAVAHGKLDGHPVVVAAFEVQFMGGTFGAAAGEAIVAAAELAVLQDAPLVLVTGSMGARVQDGAFALVQGPRVSLALRKLAERGLPLIAVLADPAFDPVTDSVLQQADVVLAEPGARLGPPAPDPFAPVDTPEFLAPRDGVRDAEAARAEGRVDRIVDRRDLKAEIAAILDVLRHPLPSALILPYPGTHLIVAPEAEDTEPNA